MKKRDRDFQIEDGVLVKYVGSDVFPIIPDGVTRIGEKAFDNGQLQAVRFPYGLTEIEYAAFRNCERLKTVIFPDTLKEIGGGAFSFCDSLEEIHIPASVEEIGFDAFAYCGNLKKFTFEGGIEMLDEMFDNCPIEELIIPDSVKAIDGLCHYCKQLKRVRLPDSLTEIGYRAFYGCAELEDINLPSALEYVDECAFYGCDKLPKKTAEKIRALNAEAFKPCEDDLQTVEELYADSDGDDYKSDGTALGDMRELAASMRDNGTKSENKAIKPTAAEKSEVVLPVERRSVAEKAQLSEFITRTERVYAQDSSNNKKGVLSAVFNPLFVVALIWAVIDFGAVIFIVISAVRENNLTSLWILLFFAVHLLPVWFYIGLLVKGLKNLTKSQAAVTDKRVYHKTGGSLAIIELADIKSSSTKKVGKKDTTVVLKLNGGESYAIEDLTNPSEFSERVERLVRRADF